jgi:hypothetical protein
MAGFDDLQQFLALVRAQDNLVLLGHRPKFTTQNLLVKPLGARGRARVLRQFSYTRMTEETLAAYRLFLDEERAGAVAGR